MPQATARATAFPVPPTRQSAEWLPSGAAAPTTGKRSSANPRDPGHAEATTTPPAVTSNNNDDDETTTNDDADDDDAAIDDTDTDTTTMPRP